LPKVTKYFSDMFLKNFFTLQYLTIQLVEMEAFLFFTVVTTKLLS